MHSMNWFLALCWMIPALLRAWRMARYYQIEEYKAERFLGWLGNKRTRWFPQPPAVMMLVGVVATSILQLAKLDSPWFNLVLWLLVVVVVALPEPIKETKKVFVPTARAKRILGVAFALCGLFVLLGGVLATGSNNIVELSTISILGFGAFLLSPLSLPLANLLLYPVEAELRRRFREQARQKLQASTVTTIGITGSYGKTSTKNFLNHILNGRFKSYATPKSYNTLMGVCLAINNDLDASYDYFIAEMGAYVPGEIAEICDLTQPKISIVTAVGPMHLERFKTLENVALAKYEIIAKLPPDGVGVFNGDDERVRAMAERGHPATRLLVTQTGGAGLAAQNIQQSPQGLTFEVVAGEETQLFQTSLLGLHNVSNILLATAVAHHLGMNLGEIAGRVAALEPAEHRLQINALPNGITIIDDAYSANPIGAASALEVLRLYTTGRRVVITPGMVELGSVEEEENHRLGRLLAASATDIVLVGIAQTKPLKKGVEESTFDLDRLLVVDTFEEARAWFQAEIRAGDAVLFLNDLPDTYL